MASKHKRSLRLLAGALAVVSASALAGEITLFQNRDFRGTTTTLQSPMLDMERNGFTTASSAVVRSAVCTNATRRHKRRLRWRPRRGPTYPTRQRSY